MHAQTMNTQQRCLCCGCFRCMPGEMAPDPCPDSPGPGTYDLRRFYDGYRDNPSRRRHGNRHSPPAWSFGPPLRRPPRATSAPQGRRTEERRCSYCGLEFSNRFGAAPEEAPGRNWEQWGGQPEQPWRGQRDEEVREKCWSYDDTGIDFFSRHGSQRRVPQFAKREKRNSSPAWTFNSASRFGPPRRSSESPGPGSYYGVNTWW